MRIDQLEFSKIYVRKSKVHSIDMTDFVESQGYQAITPEFIHSLKTSGLPNHKIKLKTSTPIMLI